MTSMRSLNLITILLFSFFVSPAQDILSQARKNLDAGKFQDAKADLSKIIDSDPKNKQALNLRGQARAGLGDLYGAISDYTYALDIDSTFAEAFNNRGQAKVNLGDEVAAIEDFDKALRFNPKYTEAFTNRGLAKYN